MVKHIDYHNLTAFEAASIAFVAVLSVVDGVLFANLTSIA